MWKCGTKCTLKGHLFTVAKVKESEVAQSCLTLCDPNGLQHARPPCPAPAPRLYSNSCPCVSDAIQPSHPLTSPSPSAFSLSQHQGLFQWVSSSHQIEKVLKFQLQRQSFQWIFRTVSLRMDWLDLLAVQGTLKSLLQHHSSKASILRRSAFFTSIRDHWKNHSFD